LFTMNAAAKKADDQLGKRPVGNVTTDSRVSDTLLTMKAVTWQGTKSVLVENVPIPEILHDQDAIIRITSTSICSGSDGHLYAGEIPGLDQGMIMGHEGMGIVESVGSAVKTIKPGMRVVVAFDLACGHCSFCKEHKYTACTTTNDSRLAEKAYGAPHCGVLGYGRLMGGYQGMQAEKARIPFADTNCLPIPDSLPDEKALFISDVLCTALHATEWSDVAEGKSVCVWGLGPIGLLSCRWAQIKGARRVVAIDTVPERMELAKEHLHIEVLDRRNLSSDEVCKKLRELEPEGFDSCIEAVGFRYPISKTHKIARAVGLETDSAELIDECLTVVRSYGSICLIGDYAGYANNFPVGKLMFRAIHRLSSSQCPVQKYWKYVLKCLKDGTIDPTFIITQRLNSLEEFPKAYAKLDSKEDGWIKLFCTLTGQFA